MREKRGSFTDIFDLEGLVEATNETIARTNFLKDTIPPITMEEARIYLNEGSLSGPVYIFNGTQGPFFVHAHILELTEAQRTFHERFTLDQLLDAFQDDFPLLQAINYARKKKHLPLIPLVTPEWVENALAVGILPPAWGEEEERFGYPHLLALSRAAQAAGFDGKMPSTFNALSVGLIRVDRADLNLNALAGVRDVYDLDDFNKAALTQSADAPSSPLPMP